MPRAIPILSAAIVVPAFLASGRAQADDVPYDLRPGSYLVNDCLCGRRAIQIPIEGTFVLTDRPPGVDLNNWQISAVDFHATPGNGDVSIRGTGTYRIVFPATESLVLDLEIAGETGIHFESDGSPNAQPWPLLEMSADEKPGAPTRIYRLHLNAAPIGRPVSYSLAPGSTFTDDCTICGRPPLEIPIAGTFTLAEV